MIPMESDHLISNCRTTFTESCPVEEEEEEKHLCWLCCEAKCLNLGLNLSLHTCGIFTSSEGSGETVQMLVEALVARRYNNYHHFMDWLKLFGKNESFRNRENLKKLKTEDSVSLGSRL